MNPLLGDVDPWQVLRTKRRKFPAPRRTSIIDKERRGHVACHQPSSSMIRGGGSSSSMTMSSRRENLRIELVGRHLRTLCDVEYITFSQHAALCAESVRSQSWTLWSVHRVAAQVNMPDLERTRIGEADGLPACPSIPPRRPTRFPKKIRPARHVHANMSSLRKRYSQASENPAFPGCITAIASWYGRKAFTRKSHLRSGCEN